MIVVLRTIERAINDRLRMPQRANWLPASHARDGRPAAGFAGLGWDLPGARRGRGTSQDGAGLEGLFNTKPIGTVKFDAEPV